MKSHSSSDTKKNAAHEFDGVSSVYVLNESSGLYEPMSQKSHDNRQDCFSGKDEESPLHVNVLRDWLVVTVSLLTILLLIPTVYYSYRSATAAEHSLGAIRAANDNSLDASEKQLRAYVFNTSNSRVERSPDNTVQIYMELKNYGLTPANRITYGRITYLAPKQVRVHQFFRDNIWPETSEDAFNLGASQTACITCKNVIPNTTRVKGSSNPIIYLGVDLQYTDIYNRCKFNAVGLYTMKAFKDAKYGKPLELGYAFGWDDNPDNTKCKVDTTYGPRGVIPKDLKVPEDGVFPSPLEATVTQGECPKRYPAK